MIVPLHSAGDASPPGGVSPDAAADWRSHVTPLPGRLCAAATAVPALLRSFREPPRLAGGRCGRLRRSTVVHAAVREMAFNKGSPLALRPLKNDHGRALGLVRTFVALCEVGVRVPCTSSSTHPASPRRATHSTVRPIDASCSLQYFFQTQVTPRWPNSV